MREEAPPMDELLQATRALLDVLVADDKEGLPRLLIPGGPADALVDLFGPIALGVAAGLHVPSNLHRAIQARSFGREAELELARQAAGDEPWERYSTLVLRLHRKTWRAWSLLPIPFGKSLADELDLDTLTADLLEGQQHLPLRPEGPRDDVERLVLAAMPEDKFHIFELASAARVWRDFVRKVRPGLERPASWAAAVEYVVSLLEFRPGTQGSIGNKYGVSANTVAGRYKTIVAALGLYQYDERYSLHRMPLYRESLALGVPARQLRMPLGAGRGKGFF
jgi:hypothetical protein